MFCLTFFTCICRGFSMPGAHSLEAVGLDAPLGSGLRLAAVAAVYILPSAAQNLQQNSITRVLPQPIPQIPLCAISSMQRAQHHPCSVQPALLPAPCTALGAGGRLRGQQAAWRRSTAGGRVHRAPAISSNPGTEAMSPREHRQPTGTCTHCQSHRGLT